MEMDFNQSAKKHGFDSVHELKKYVALKIKQYLLFNIKLTAIYWAATGNSRDNHSLLQFI